MKMSLIIDSIILILSFRVANCFVYIPKTVIIESRENIRFYVYFTSIFIPELNRTNPVNVLIREQTHKESKKFVKNLLINTV